MGYVKCKQLNIYINQIKKMLYPMFCPDMYKRKYCVHHFVIEVYSKSF